jgi:signal transduction histidine kinase
MRFLRHEHPFFLRLLLSIGICLMFIILAVALQTVLHKPLFLFMGCVVLCSLYAGLTIGILTALLVTVAHGYFFQQPRYSFSVNSTQDLIELAIFLGVAIFMSSVGAAFRAALAAADLAKEAAETEKRSREDVLAMVSHDLKNPLLAIQMNAELILKLVKKEQTLELMKIAHSIQHSSVQMSKLIQTLLDYEKIRAGTFAIEPRELKVDQLVKDCFSSMEPIAQVKGISLELSGNFCDVLVFCDPTRVMEVLSNLLGNAIKFTARGGSVILSAEERAGQVIFCVKDTGPGIPENQLTHLFERYWQARETCREGTGLGLSIARGIIEAHGEKIWVESKVGEGSAFYFTLKRLQIRAVA